MAKWLTSTDWITFEVRDRIARITLNRPDKRNALSSALIRELHDAMLEADDLLEVSVIVLSGAGRDFCAGYDLGESYEARKREREEEGGARRYRTRMATFDDDCWTLERMTGPMKVILDLHKPVIAKVQGNCLAGGVDLASLCDIVIAADDARIGNPANRALGSPPINLWLYHIGPQWAKRLLLTGDSVSGRDAARIGLVLDAVPAVELDAEVDALARRLTHVDTDILVAQKRIVNLALELAGARTLQRLAVEADARAHLARGPRREQFMADLASVGLKEALRNRDAPFGDSMVRIRRPD